MKPAALLVALLVLSPAILCCTASSFQTNEAQAAVKQYADDSYEGPEAPEVEPGYSTTEDQPEKGGDYVKEEPVCPDPQPADSVQQVYVGHATFDWQKMAEQQAQVRARVHMQNVADNPPAEAAQAAKAAFIKDRVPGRDAAKTAAADDADALLPSKLKELEGLLGTYDPQHYPSFEAFAAGPHPTDPDLVFMLHAVKSVAQMFLTEKDGTISYLGTPTKISLQDVTALVDGFGTGFDVQSVTGFFDPLAKRYTLVWTTVSNVDDVAPAVFVAVSQTRNPLGKWAVWALNLKPTLAVGMSFCSDQPTKSYTFDMPQVSFSDDGFFIGGSNTCPTSDPDKPRSALTALYLLPKKAIYTCPPTTSRVDLKAAVYLVSKSWYRSVARRELDMVPEAFEPFNSVPAPARPQTIEDMKANPVFVMKVDHAHLSVATLTDEPLGEIVSVDSAPKLLAVVVGKGDDYISADGFSDGNAIMPQPNTTTALELAHIGMPTNYNALVFWATLYKDMLYVASGEYWGYDTIRMPSVYWAILKSTSNLCKITRKDHGLVASQDGLALAYPVIAARLDGGALLGFSYSGKGAIAGGQYPAYPGVATAIVGNGKEKPVIHIVKKGEGSLDPFHSDSIPWGIGSAAQVCGDQMWFAVPIPAAVDNKYEASLWYGSWITWQQL